MLDKQYWLLYNLLCAIGGYISIRFKQIIWQAKIVNTWIQFKSISQKLNPYLGISFLGVFVVAANLFFSATSYAQEDYDLVYLEPKIAAAAIEKINPYTPFIDEETDLVKVALAVDNSDGYLNKDDSVFTESTKLEIPYLVQKGDTLTGIAKTFNLHVATIVERNHLSTQQLENLSVGQTLIVPSTDISDSQDWLAQLNAQKEKERQLAAKEAAKKKQLASSKRTVTYRERADGGYDGNSGGNFIVPIQSKGISRGVSRGHAGIDYRADIGTPVRAAADGRVIEVTGGWGSGYGKSILVDHGGGWVTRYAHLSDFAAGTGDTVSQGQTIGYSGNTGWSTGPHLHFETRINGRAVNPF